MAFRPDLDALGALAGPGDFADGRYAYRGGGHFLLPPRGASPDLVEIARTQPAKAGIS
jgi:hypothetical protein